MVCEIEIFGSIKDKEIKKFNNRDKYIYIYYIYIYILYIYIYIIYNYI